MKSIHYLNFASEVLGNSTEASLTQDNSLVSRISASHSSDEGPQKTFISAGQRDLYLLIKISGIYLSTDKMPGLNT